MSSAKPFLAIMTVLVPLASAQTVDQIVARSIQARGGLARIKSVRTVRQTERVIMGQMPESPAVVIQKRPGMVRGEFHFPGLDLVEAYDGHTAWSMPNHSQVSPMSADSARQLQESADIDGPLVDYGGKGSKVQLVGKGNLNGVFAYELRVRLRNGDQLTIFLDAKSFLEIKEENQTKLRGTDRVLTTTKSDYRRVNGLMFPFAIENSESGSPVTQKIIVSKIEINVDIPDGIFRPPNASTRPVH